MTTTTKDALDQRIRAKRTAAVVVVNAYSRQGERLFRRALGGLVQRGMGISASYAVRDPVRLPDIVKEAIASGSGLVVIGSGDGTISSVVGFFADRDVVLGILPLGTSNRFARTLGIPLSLDRGDRGHHPWAGGRRGPGPGGRGLPCQRGHHWLLG
jgi:diacylglycerol kinase (ATP)